MIVICEKCGTRYLVSGYVLEPEGHVVRCSRCRHEWFQQPEHEDDDFLPGDDEDDYFEPIPESVRPVPEGSALPAPHLSDEQRGQGKGVLAGVGAALLVGAVLFGGLVLFRVPVSASWPAATAFYALIGMDVPVMGEHLIFDHLKASKTVSADGAVLLDVSGKIINLDQSATGIPSIRASLRQDGGDVVDSWLIRPEEKSLGPQGELDFHSSTPAKTGDVNEINLQFVLGQ